MFKLLKNAFKVKDIRSKILFTVLILFVFRLGAHITVPGVNAKGLSDLSSLPFLNMLNMVSGSAMQNFSIFSMGVSPYITASIIIQLLQMDIVPRFVEWSKQGEVGRKKLNQATRYLTIVLGVAQSMGITAGFNSLSQTGIVNNPTLGTFVMIAVILTAGTMFVTWMGEQITEKGIGNGVSMIISRLPGAVKEIYEDYFVNIESSRIWQSVIFIAILVIAILVIVTVVTFFQQAERKIPIQYTKRVSGAPTSSYLPLKVNAAGVIPVIFASSLIATPNAILQAEKLAENLQKQGSYIPSVRPGKGTEEYVSGVLMRLSVVGSIFLGLVALLPIIAQMVWNLPQSIGLGGTSLLIVIGVALETTKQLEGLMMKRQYVGFINK